MIILVRGLIVALLVLACTDVHQGVRGRTPGRPEASSEVDAGVSETNVADDPDVDAEPPSPDVGSDTPDVASDPGATDVVADAGARLCDDVTCTSDEPCCTAYCEPSTGECLVSCVSDAPPDDACQSAEQCDDADPCTIDRCEEQTVGSACSGMVEALVCTHTLRSDCAP